MKIAMIGQKGVPAIFGGIERHVDELSSRLADRGHEVLVYCRKWYIDTEIQMSKSTCKTVRQIVVPTIRTKHLDAVVHTLLSTLHAIRENPDIYHYHGVGPSLLSWIPRLVRPHARVITTFHCIDRKHQKWGLVARIALRLGEWAACRFAHTTITVSRTLEQYCQEVYETSTVYIPNGVSNRDISGDTLIKRFGLVKNEYIAQVARLVRHKGEHLTISAWQTLRREHPELAANKKLVIVGDGAFTDDYVTELKQLAADDTSIVFTGFQSGAMLDELFTNALFLVHPSLSEGLPITVLEAMSYGKVVVASDIPENMEVIAENGVAVRTGDVHDLAKKMEMLLKAVERLPKVGARARTFVLEHYHWDDIASAVLRVYERAQKNVKTSVPKIPEKALF